ncbi:flavin reductase family protein [Rhodococcus sp. HNM0569]|nr:flavin reductase family protein [Rhodococcus sp. HNM0569]NLU83113.1 flavin reductase family protein [Rhodococcus sp. HNM0569]
MWNSEIFETLHDAHTVAAETPAGVTDPRKLRDTLGSFATGVTVLTYCSGGAYHGMTVNSFTSVSLEPPLVLVSLMRTSRALTYLLERPFAVNVLGDDQLQTARQFAGKPDDTHVIDWVTDEDAPRIDGSLAYFQCTPWASYDGGDHVLLLGKVSSFGTRESAEPLLFYQGRWGALAPGGH